MRGRQLVAALAVLLALTLAGCGSDRLPASELQPVDVPALNSQPPEAPIPVRIEVPAIQAVSSLIPLKLGKGDVLETPPVTQPMQAGWFSEGYRPGEPGPAVVAGHVDGQVNGHAGTPGIFFRLKELELGAKATVFRADGSHLEFIVYRKVAYDKDSFATQEVYGKTPGPELRLITCDGTFDRAKRSYNDNLVVYLKEA